MKSKKQVINNIYQATKNQNFNAKVEVDDVQLTSAQSKKILTDFCRHQQTYSGRFENWMIRRLAIPFSKFVTHSLRITGKEKIADLSGGAIITSNHFSYFENAAIRLTLRECGYKRLFIVSQETNLVNSKLTNWLIRNYDLLPIASQGTNINYMGHEFPKHIQKVLNLGYPILIYPEQEMWYNYRKPRPTQRGAYYYAAKFNVPIISCWVEAHDTGKRSNKEFNRTEYTVHILDPIFPNNHLSVREAAKKLQQQDYQQKVAAYEKAWGEPLTYKWEDNDIIGWRKEKQFI